MAEETASMPVFRCRACQTLFEDNIADPDEDGAPRCPQCFLSDSELTVVAADDFVVRAGTKFR